MDTLYTVESAVATSASDSGTFYTRPSEFSHLILSSIVFSTKPKSIWRAPSLRWQPCFLQTIVHWEGEKRFAFQTFPGDTVVSDWLAFKTGRLFRISQDQQLTCLGLWVETKKEVYSSTHSVIREAIYVVYMDYYPNRLLPTDGKRARHTKEKFFEWRRRMK